MSVKAFTVIEFRKKREIDEPSDIDNYELRKKYSGLLALANATTFARVGIRAGIDAVLKRRRLDGILTAVPRNTDVLVKDVEKTVLDSVAGVADYPFVVEIGAPNTPYAKYVHEFTPHTAQIRHKHGDQMSGVYGKYPYHVKAAEGDLKAEYRFFNRVASELAYEIELEVEKNIRALGLWDFYVYNTLVLK